MFNTFISLVPEQCYPARKGLPAAAAIPELQHVIVCAPIQAPAIPIVAVGHPGALPHLVAPPVVDDQRVLRIGLDARYPERIVLPVAVRGDHVRDLQPKHLSGMCRTVVGGIAVHLGAPNSGRVGHRTGPIGLHPDGKLRTGTGRKAADVPAQRPAAATVAGTAVGTVMRNVRKLFGEHIGHHHPGGKVAPDILHLDRIVELLPDMDPHHRCGLGDAQVYQRRIRHRCYRSAVVARYRIRLAARNYGRIGIWAGSVHPGSYRKGRTGTVGHRPDSPYPRAAVEAARTGGSTDIGIARGQLLADAYARGRIRTGIVGRYRERYVITYHRRHAARRLRYPKVRLQRSRYRGNRRSVVRRIGIRLRPSDSGRVGIAARRQYRSRYRKGGAGAIGKVADRPYPSGHVIGPHRCRRTGKGIARRQQVVHRYTRGICRTVVAGGDGKGDIAAHHRTNIVYRLGNHQVGTVYRLLGKIGSGINNARKHEPRTRMDADQAPPVAAAAAAAPYPGRELLAHVRKAVVEARTVGARTVGIGGSVVLQGYIGRSAGAAADLPGPVHASGAQGNLVGGAAAIFLHLYADVP